MNPLLKEALTKQSLRREIKKRLSERSDRVDLSEATLYKAFVEPFTDVLQAANLASQDMLNSSTTMLRLFMTFSPEKANEILKKHDERRDKIAAKWKPLMDRTDEALSTGDADLIALTLAPQFWAASAVGTAAANYGGNMVEFLDNAGLGSLVKIALPGVSITKVDDTPKDSSILDKMSNLFLGAVAAKAFLDGIKRAGTPEKEKQNEARSLREQKESPDFEDELDNFMQDTGLIKKFEKDAQDLFEDLQKAVKEFDEDFDARKDLTEKLVDADSFEAFSTALDSVEGDQALNPQEIKSEMKKSVEKLVSSEEFASQVKETSKKEEVSEDELVKAAQKVVFLDAKKNMEEDFGGFEEGFKKYATEMGKAVQDLLPTDAGMKILKQSKSPQAASIRNFVEKTKQKYFIA